MTWRETWGEYTDSLKLVAGPGVGWIEASEWRKYQGKQPPEFRGNPGESLGLALIGYDVARDTTFSAVAPWTTNGVDCADLHFSTMQGRVVPSARTALALATVAVRYVKPWWTVFADFDCAAEAVQFDFGLNGYLKYRSLGDARRDKRVPMGGKREAEIRGIYKGDSDGGVLSLESGSHWSGVSRVRYTHTGSSGLAWVARQLAAAKEPVEIWLGPVRFNPAASTVPFRLEFDSSVSQSDALAIVDALATSLADRGARLSIVPGRDG